MRVYAIVTGVLIMAASGCVTSGDLSRLLPDEIDGWKPGEPDGVYDADTLHDYIDGAAGVYRAFGVQAALGRRYIKPGAADILVDVFDMGSAKGAYGAYHHDVREGKNVDIGHESEYADGSLAFWKGRYFVSIIPFDGMDESREAAFKMGRTVTSGIPFKGRKPTLVKQVPLEGLIAGRLHYFRDKILLDAHYDLAEDNILHLGPDTEGILAWYRSSTPGEDPYALMLIRYPSTARAAQAHADFTAAYLPDAGADGIAQTKDGRWAGARQQGASIRVVLEAPSKAQVLAALARP